MFNQLNKEKALAIVRIITGILLVYHGLEVFNVKQMAEYAQWDMFKNLSFGLIMVYIGKGSELIAGILLMIGFWTRLASIILILTMIYITFFIGKGKFWYEDQHPFLFILLGFIYLFNGAGIWGFDKKEY
jgi:putative oxidoreductase